MMMANVSFVVFKINDIDVCQLPQEQRTTVLDLLLNEETENVVLELKRTSWWKRNKNIDFDDLEINKKMCFLKIHHNTKGSCCGESTASIDSETTINLHLPPPNIQKYCVTKSTQTEDIAFYVHEHLRHIQKNTDRLIDHEHNLFEQSLAPEIDIEEITLRKSDSNERLGITVCYSNSEDIFGGEIVCDTMVTEVYISDIHPDSVAGRDGRLRQGDQILQINGKDIKTRPETETLIAENNNAVTLLVSRYLYADEDDFNDPSTNEEDDEVLIVEEDEDDDDDEEFYEENNMTYVNCVISNDCCISATEALDKALMSQVVQQEQFQQVNRRHEEKNSANTAFSGVLQDSSYQSNTVKSTNDTQKEKNSKIGRKTSSLKCGKTINLMSTKIETIMSPSDKAKVDYETEHIYETIPEDPEPESEPFYCSPYDSSVYVTNVVSCTSSTITDALQHLQQKQRVAQWLGIRPGICSTTAPRQSVRSGNNSGRSCTSGHRSINGTVRSIATTFVNDTVDWGVVNNTLPVSCPTEDQDNSSSAYNTGGSNNSVSPLTLMSNPKIRCDQNVSMTTSAINIPVNGTSDDDAIQQMYQKNQKTNSPKEKSKIMSPKSSSAHTVKTNVGGPTSKITDVHMSPAVNKEINVHRNMLLRQHLFSQKLNLEKTLQPHPYEKGKQLYYQQHYDQTHCPQFTAPNLSQYHFVSSQEVNNLSLTNNKPKISTTEASAITNNKKEEETMVWKVKRRPDGTRYIVRRPAKSRVIKERSARLNAERVRNDITTTEDDTISEIKTGRYWKREERKKHIEKAKERRQQHQQQLLYQYQNKEPVPYDLATTVCVGDVNYATHDSNEQGKIKNQHNVHLSRQSQKIANQQQHYQLQFNSTENHKLATLIKNKESPTNKSQQKFSINLEDFSSGKGDIDKTEILNAMALTLSEQNEINNVLQSVTTS